MISTAPVRARVLTALALTLLVLALVPASYTTAQPLQIAKVHTIQGHSSVHTDPPIVSQQLLRSAELANHNVLISNSLLLYSPSVTDFDVAAFLNTQVGPLGRYSEENKGQLWTAADIIQYNAILFGINPQVIIVILEADGHLITDASASVPLECESGQLHSDETKNFYCHVNHIAARLLIAYDAHRYHQSDNRVHFSTGEVLTVSTDLNAGSYAVQFVLAQLLPRDLWELWVQGSPPLFLQQYTNWFDDPLADPDWREDRTTALPGGYVLPFPVGETWYYTGGPHTYNASGARPWSSIDIAPPEVIGCPGGSYPAGRWIVAAKGGTVIQSSQALVVIDHGDGWRTYYSHVATTDRRGIGPINQGDHVGHPSCETEPGGSTSGIHVHFAIWQAGVGFVDISGSSLSGWLVQETTHYNGTMTRNGVTRWASTGRINGYNDIYNYGTNCPQSGGVILYWNENYNCNNGEGDPGYRQRTSTGWENISGAFNDQASSLRVPSGWSVRLYEHADRGGASVCRNSDDPNFEGDNFDGGLGLNDKVSSFEVFANSNCGGSPGQEVKLYSLANYEGSVVFNGGVGFSNGPNADSYSMEIPGGWSAKTWRGDNRTGEQRCWSQSVSNLQDHGWHLAIQSIEVYDYNACPPSPPSPPSLSSPANGATLSQDTSITLDWNSSSGATEYYAHLWGGPSIDINSGWIGGTDWNVGQQWPGTYQWNVKARNSGGESGWSSTWSFTVAEDDTTPPTGRITSPSDGAVIGACPVTIQADASDTGSGVAYVEFHTWCDDGTGYAWQHLGNDSTSPYSLNWDCSSFPDQSLILTIHIWDNAGNEVMDPGGYVHVTLDRGAPVGNGTGLPGTYYDNMNFTDPKVTRVDETIDFDWGDGSPDPSMDGDTFSVRWVGQVQPRYSEQYTFYTYSDDGVRLWVNGQLVIGNWTDHSVTEDSGTINLVAGKKYNIRLDYYEKGGGAIIQLSWSSASQAKQIIPKSQLYRRPYTNFIYLPLILR